MVSHRGHGVHREIFIIRNSIALSNRQIKEFCCDVSLLTKIYSLCPLKLCEEFIVYFLLPGDLRLRRLL